MADKLFPQNHFYWNCMVKQFTRVKLPAFSSVVMLVTLALTLHVGKFKRIWLMREWFKTEFLIWRSQLVDGVYSTVTLSPISISMEFKKGPQWTFELWWDSFHCTVWKYSFWEAYYCSYYCLICSIYTLWLMSKNLFVEQKHCVCRHGILCFL